MSKQDLHRQIEEADKNFRESIKAIATSELPPEEQDRKLEQLTQGYREQVQGLTLASLLMHR